MFTRARISWVAVVVLASGLIIGPAVSAGAATSLDTVPTDSIGRGPDAREPAGQYNFQCLLENGRTINLGASRPAKGACKGWLQVYIGGKQVGHINTGGKLGPGDSVSCLAGAGLGLMSLFTGSTPIGWATLASLAVTGIGCSGH